MITEPGGVAAFFSTAPQVTERVVWLQAAHLALLLDADVAAVLAAAQASGHPVRGAAIGVARTRALVALRRLFEHDAGRTA